MIKSFKKITVLTGDHRLPDTTKRNSRFNDEDTTTTEAMKSAFRSLPEYEFTFLDNHATLLDQLRENLPDLVVNFCDTGFENRPDYELNIPAYLELLGIPYTGAPPAAMVICYDKAIVRLVASAHGVPVPREQFIEAGVLGVAKPDFYPVILKPNTADGSVGITKDAVVRSPEEAHQYLNWMRKALPGYDVLAQEYLSGPEYGMAAIGNLETELHILPLLEVDYSRLPAELTPILSFESKVFPDSPYWTDVKFRTASLSSDLEEKMKAWVKILFNRLGLRDYARFDFRVGADGEPKLLEVNPNPAWAYDGKMAFMAGFAGLEYREMLHLIVKAAIGRLSA